MAMQGRHCVSKIWCFVGVVGFDHVPLSHDRTEVAHYMDFTWKLSMRAAVRAQYLARIARPAKEP